MAGPTMMLKPLMLWERTDFNAIVKSIVAENKRNDECRHCRIKRFVEKMSGDNYEAWAFDP